jgi:hypothetical protein
LSERSTAIGGLKNELAMHARNSKMLSPRLAQKNEACKFMQIK